MRSKKVKCLGVVLDDGLTWREQIANGPFYTHAFPCNTLLLLCVWFAKPCIQAFVACSTNTGKGLVKLITCSDVPGHWVDVWRS